MLEKIDLNSVINLAIKVGNNILETYQTTNFEDQTKQDDSPLTKADKKSHEFAKFMVYSKA